MADDDEPLPGSISEELIERLRALEAGNTADSLADIAYGRAREAMDQAIDEARSIRLQAIDDARATREREMTALLESLRGLRASAEAQINGLIRAAEIEASRITDRARGEAHEIIQRADSEAARVRDEATAIRNLAQERLSEVERLEADFNRVAGEIARRLGITENSGGSWWRKLISRRERL
jgi:hypothetical protein